MRANVEKSLISLRNVPIAIYSAKSVNRLYCESNRLDLCDASPLITGQESYPSAMYVGEEKTRPRALHGNPKR